MSRFHGKESANELPSVNNCFAEKKRENLNAFLKIIVISSDLKLYSKSKTIVDKKLLRREAREGPAKSEVEKKISNITDNL